MRCRRKRRAGGEQGSDHRGPQNCLLDSHLDLLSRCETAGFQCDPPVAPSDDFPCAAHRGLSLPRRDLWLTVALLCPVTEDAVHRPYESPPRGVRFDKDSNEFPPPAPPVLGEFSPP